MGLGSFGRGNGQQGRPGKGERAGEMPAAPELTKLQRIEQSVKIETPKGIRDTIIFGLTVAAMGEAVNIAIRSNQQKAKTEGLSALKAFELDAEAPAHTADVRWAQQHNVELPADITLGQVTVRKLDGTHVAITASDAALQALRYASAYQEGIASNVQAVREKGDQNYDPIGKAHEFIGKLAGNEQLLQRVGELAAEQWHVIADGELDQMSQSGRTLIHVVAERVKAMQKDGKGDISESNPLLSESERQRFMEALPDGVVAMIEDIVKVPLHMLPGSQQVLSSFIKLLPGGIFIDKVVTESIKGIEGGPEQVLKVLRQVFAEDIRGQDLKPGEINAQFSALALSMGVTVRPEEMADFVATVATQMAFEQAEQFSGSVVNGRVVTPSESMPELARVAQVAGELDLFQPAGLSLTRKDAQPAQPSAPTAARR